MLPPAPARFSTTTCWPSRELSRGAIARATRSLAPPGANPTSRRTGLLGYASAAQLWDAPSISIAAQQAQQYRSLVAIDCSPRDFMARVERPQSVSNAQLGGSGGSHATVYYVARASRRAADRRKLEHGYAG